MTINLDGEIVATAFDPIAGTCSYTLERGGKRWTVSVPLQQLDAHGPVSLTKQIRRNHVGGLLTQAMAGPADGEA